MDERAEPAFVSGQGAAVLFIPPDAFVCKKCASKVRKAQSVSNSSVPRPVPVPVPEPIIIISVLPPPPSHKSLTKMEYL